MSSLRSLAVLAVVACSGGGTPNEPIDPGNPISPGTPIDSAVPPALPSIDSLTVPSGLRATKFATVPGARMMAVGPDGALYVSQTDAGRVVRVVDANNDGVAESQSNLLSGLDKPHGLAWNGDQLYVALGAEVVRVRVANGSAGPVERLAQYANSGGGHYTRSIVISGGAMYVSIGSSCNICEEASTERAAVMKYDLDGKNGRRYAFGLRNAVGLAVHPPTGEIWVSTHERDNLTPSHEDLPPEEIDILMDGGDYGWPYCHSNRVPNPEFSNQARCNSTIAPALMMQAHSAPMGVTFLASATKIPAAMRGDMLVAFHGSWNRSVPTGAKVVRVTVANNRPTGVVDFVSGFQRSNGTRWGRPVDVVVWKDGSVLVSDDLNGGIYRVSQ